MLSRELLFVFVFVMVFTLAFVAVWLCYCNYFYCCFYPSGGPPFYALTLDFGCDRVFSQTMHATGVIVMDGVVNVIDDCGIVVILCGHCFFVVFIDITVQRWC